MNLLVLTSNLNIKINEMDNININIDDWKNYKNIDPSLYDKILIFETWDYHYKIKQFTYMIDKFNHKLINNYNILKWNMNKKYLLDLEKREINIVPSIISKNINKKDLDKFDYKSDFFIIKPIYGGSSKDVLYKNINDLDNTMKFNYEMIIQPYIKGISNGEYSLIYYGLNFSHMIVKKFQNINDKILKYNNRMIERVSNDNQYYDSLKSFSINVLKKLNILPNYARIDLIIDDGIIYLLELELIDPNLFYQNNDEQLKNMIINIFND